MLQRRKRERVSILLTLLSRTKTHSSYPASQTRAVQMDHGGAFGWTSGAFRFGARGCETAVMVDGTTFLILSGNTTKSTSKNRAELGSAFVEISESKCVNGISWTLTDMPIVILDNESMVLEKPKDAGNELSMDLVL